MFSLKKDQYPRQNRIDDEGLEDIIEGDYDIFFDDLKEINLNKL